MSSHSVPHHEQFKLLCLAGTPLLGLGLISQLPQWTLIAPPSPPSYSGTLRREKTNFAIPTSLKEELGSAPGFNFHIYLQALPQLPCKTSPQTSPSTGVRNCTLHFKQLSWGGEWDKSFKSWISHFPSHSNPIFLCKSSEPFSIPFFAPSFNFWRNRTFVQTDNWRNSKSPLGYVTICQGPEAPRKWCKDDGWRCETKLSLHSWGINQLSGRLNRQAWKTGHRAASEAPAPGTSARRKMLWEQLQLCTKSKWSWQFPGQLFLEKALILAF